MERSKGSNLVQGAAGSSLQEQVAQHYLEIDRLMAQGVAKAMRFNVFSQVESDSGWTLACIAKNVMSDREAMGWARRVMQETGFSVRIYMNPEALDGEDGDDCYISSVDPGRVYFQRVTGGIEMKELDNV